MAEEQEKILADEAAVEEIEYSEEDLGQIEELTQMFTRAPGQVDIDDGEEPAEEADDEDATGPEIDEAAEEAAHDEAPSVPTVDLDKFKDIDDIDVLTGDSTPTSGVAAEAGDDASGLADLGDLDDLGDLSAAGDETPAAPSLDDIEPGVEEPPTSTDELGGLDDLADLNEVEAPAETPAVDPGADDLGGLDDLGSLDDAGLGDLDAGTDTPAADAGVDDLGGLDDLGSLDDAGLGDLDAGTDAPAADAGAGDLGGLDELGSLDDAGLGDLDAGTDAPAADAGAGDLGGLDDLGSLDDAGLGDLDAGIDAPAADAGAGDLGGLDELGSLDDAGLGDLDTGTDAPAADAGVGDLGGLDELGSLDDAGLGDLDAGTDSPAGDLGGLDELGSLDDAGVEGLDDLSTDDAGGLDSPADAPTPPSLDDDLGSLDTSMTDDEPAEVQPPSLDDLSPEVALSEPATVAASGGGLDLASDLSDLEEETKHADEVTDAEIKQLRARLKDFPPGIRKQTIDAIVEDKISDKDAKQLVGRIIDGAEPDEIKTYLENKLDVNIDDTPEVVRKKSKVIVARPQYTEDGLRRQQKMLRYARLGSIAALVLIVIGTGIYQYVYKPLRYDGLIEQGKKLIMQNQPEAPPEKAVKEAEQIFSQALEYYPEESKAYLQYADAYKRVGLYQNSFEKLFGKVMPDLAGGVVRYGGEEIRTQSALWRKLKKVPIVAYADKNEDARPRRLKINKLNYLLYADGAYTLTHLKKEQDEAKVLLALGSFHSNPVRRFRNKDYRNNLLGIDYFRRILTFDPYVRFTESKDEYLGLAIMGIGDVYYNQKQYYKALDYYEKVKNKDPYSIPGHAGVLKALLKIYQQTNDPRMIIQQHSIIKHKLGIEDELPIYMLARMAGFYIDLPGNDDLRVKYNVSPLDSVDSTALKDRAPQLLNILANKEDEDAYGNIIKGREFAEGYYQRGRYYRYVVNEMRMAMKQMEYAYKYDKRHFMALNERAEMLMQLHDYNAAISLLNKYALPEIGPGKIDNLGDRPEDETLIEADRAIIPFNIGKAMYLSTVQDLGNTDSWLRIQEAEKFKGKLDYGLQGLDERLKEIDRYLARADEIGLQSDTARAEMLYYRGWAAYVRGNYEKALARWETMTLYRNKVVDSAASSQQNKRRLRNLELAKSHALFQLSVERKTAATQRETHLRTALGYLFFLQEHYNNQAQKISTPSSNNKNHVRLFSRLAIIENNMGAIYEILDDEKRALRHYWRSIDYSKKIARENEIAHLNIKLSFKRQGLTREKYPLIMDFIPPKLTEEAL